MWRKELPPFVLLVFNRFMGCESIGKSMAPGEIRASLDKEAAGSPELAAKDNQNLLTVQ